MRNIFMIASVFIILLMNGCDRCDGIACVTGPPVFSVELIDSETGVNVFTSKKYDSKSIQLTDEANQAVYLNFISENNINIFNVSIDSEKSRKIILKVGADVVIPMEVNIREGSGGCCTNYFIDDIKVIGYDVKASEKAGLIIIKI